MVQGPHAYTDDEFEAAAKHLEYAEAHFNNGGRASQQNAIELLKIAQSLELTIERVGALQPTDPTKPDKGDARPVQTKS